MIVVGLVLIYLAIRKEMEPTLLLPMGFGAILVNLPGSVMLEEHAILQWLYSVGIESAEAFPLLLFIGIGAMIDFGPLISKPWLIFIGAAGQGGIFISMIIASLMGFPLNDAASIGIIGAADGPTAILVSQRLNSNYVAAILVVAYCYMALVPMIQPVVLKATTTKKERAIRMHYTAASVSKTTRIIFPIVTTIVCGILAPDPLKGCPGYAFTAYHPDAWSCNLPDEVRSGSPPGCNTHDHGIRSCRIHLRHGLRCYLPQGYQHLPSEG